MSVAGIVNTLGNRTARAADIVPTLRGVPEAALAASYDLCRTITRERARNFYYGLRLMPEPRRSAIFSIYAWMRAADDEADGEGSGRKTGPAPGASERLREFRRITEAVLAGDLGAAHDGQPTPGFWPAFAATVHAYRLDHGIFRSMLDGLEEDLAHDGYDTDADLARYCYCVASTVGLACIGVWGLRDDADAEHAHELAVRRGQAFQRTNILRDFAEDFDGKPRRIYLPREAFARHGLTPEDVRTWRDPARCRAFMLEQAAQTRAEYAASAGLEGMIDPACAPTLWAMTRIYSGLLEVIERDPARIVAGRRIRLAGPHKALIAIRATWRSRRAGW